MVATEFTYSNPCCGIYRIYHITSGKTYIGSSSRIYGRWITHRGDLRKGRHHSPALQRAWAKYGEDAFAIEIVEHIADTTLLAERETFYMEQYDCVAPNGYNVSPVGGSTIGLKLGPHSAEHRQKIGLGQKGRKAPQEQRDRQSARLKGRVMSAEWRAKIAATMTGQKRGPLSPEHKAAISAVHKGKKLSQEQLDALRKNATGRPKTPEERAKRSASLRAYHQRRRTLIGAAQLPLDI